MTEPVVFQPPHDPDLGVRLKWYSHLGYLVEFAEAHTPHPTWQPREPTFVASGKAHHLNAYRVSKPDSAP